METKKELTQQNTQETKPAPQPAQMQPTPQPAQMQTAPARDPRSLGQYAIDKTFEAAGRELDRMEQEKPGTRRKLAGITTLVLGVGGISTGIYLLTT